MHIVCVDLYVSYIIIASYTIHINKNNL